MKQLLQISTLVLFYSLVQPSCNSNTSPTASTHTKTLEKDCIKKVLALDSSLGTIRNHACETISLSETILNYTKEMGKIDYQNCPQNFSKAFEQHRKAWVEMIVVTDKYPNLRGELHDLFDIIEKGKDQQEFKSRLDAIWSTWGEVEQAMKVDQ